MVADNSKPGYSEAREELHILEMLYRDVWANISRLSKRPSFDGETGEVDLLVHDARQNTLKGYKELAAHCYGRTVSGVKVDEENSSKKPFTYRITQANVGSPNCRVISRNSPIATKLVSAQLNEEIEDNRDGTRYFKIQDTRAFEGPTSLHLPGEYPDFRSMLLQRLNISEPVFVLGLRSFVEEGSEPRVITKSFQAAEKAVDHTWVDDWSNVQLADSEIQSLSPRFFTQTSRDQEDVLNKPHGLTLVQGVAGAGKTSAALGRLKFFANFETGENREFYGLNNASESDFSPDGMIGFVLSHSLKRYLKDTAIALNIERLPIRDFQEFRTYLSTRFGLSRSFKRRPGRASPYRTRLEWLRAVDTAISRIVGQRLESLVSTTPDISASVRRAVDDLASDLKGAKPTQGSFHLSKLAQKLVGHVMNAEYRAREDAIQSRRRNSVFQERVDLENELRHSRLQEERGVVTPVASLILENLIIQDLLAQAVLLQSFPEIVKTSFNGLEDKALDECVAEIRDLFASRKEGERLALTDDDLLGVIVAGALLADDFEYSNAPKHIYRVRKYNCVFIDEVQDFTELEVLLMGMTALTKYNQITLSGDLCQRLQSNGAKQYQDLFPFITRSNQNNPVFLSRNFRQRGSLKLLSAGFRRVLQNDPRVEFDAENVRPALVHSYSLREEMASLMFDRISAVNEYATVAVIVPTGQEAQDWHDLLSQDLATGLRPALLARREDLTRRFEIHFTEVYEAKGLEFDVVIVPDLGSFELENEIGQNQAYVAISRAKHSLLLGCNVRGANSPAISKLINHNLIEMLHPR